MKKILIFLLVVIVLSFVFAYTFIRSNISVSVFATVPGTRAGIDSGLHSIQKWKEWWPSSAMKGSTTADSFFTYNKNNYRLSEKYSDGAAIRIQSGNTNIASQIQSVPKNNDTLFIQWTAIVPAGINPVERVKNYLKAKGLRDDMKAILKNLYDYTKHPENIYGFDIKRTTFTDTTLIAKRFTGKGTATTVDIYRNIARLREYITHQGAVEKDVPMINISYAADSSYEAMIAICVDRVLPSSGEFFLRRMVPMKDRFLACEVTGGPFRIQLAHRSVEKYMFDNSLSAPAIPFELLVTDRSRETDTSKWVTKIFYPSM